MKFSKVLEAKTRPYRRLIQEDKLDGELATKLLIETFAETVILGWEGVKDKRGKNVPHTTENAVKLLVDLPDLFSELREAASKQSNFRTAEIADDAGN
jgi:hypothetical protein